MVFYKLGLYVPSLWWSAYLKTNQYLVCLLNVSFLETQISLWPPSRYKQFYYELWFYYETWFFFYVNRRNRNYDIRLAIFFQVYLFINRKPFTISEKLRKFDIFFLIKEFNCKLLFLIVFIVFLKNGALDLNVKLDVHYTSEVLKLFF